MRTKLIIVSLILCGFCLTEQIKATDTGVAPYVEQLTALRVSSNGSRIDISSFEDLWKPTFDQLKQSTNLEAESELERYMEELTGLLLYNYNPSGLELLKTYASSRQLLKLAGVYFDQSTTFSDGNHPPDNMALKRTAAEIYQLVWSRADTMSKECLKEFADLRFRGCVSNLKFSCLPESLRQDMLRTIRTRLAHLHNLNADDSAIDSLRLSEISEQALLVLGEHLHYSIDPFHPGDMQRFAWCVNLVLGKGAFCVELYNYQKTKESIGNKEPFPSIKDWLSAVNPKPTQPQNSAELSRSFDSGMNQDPAY